MAPAGLETAAGSPSVWRGRPLGELSAACSRAGANTIGSATIELLGGSRIDFRSQPASFVAACAAELGLVSTSTAAVPQRERAEDKAVSSAPTAASKRRKRRKASKLQRQEAAATAAALAASSAVGEDREPSILPSPSRDPSPRGSELLASREGSDAGDNSEMDLDVREEAAAAATSALGSCVQLEIPCGLPAADVASADPVLAEETEDEEEAAKAAHLSPGDEDKMDVGEREEAAAAATAALRSCVQLEIPRGLASANPVPEDETEDEKEVAAAAHPSAQAAGAPWVLVRKNGTVEAVDSDVRSADMAACKQSVSVSGKEKGDEDGDPFSCDSMCFN